MDSERFVARLRALRVLPVIAPAGPDEAAAWARTLSAAGLPGVLLSTDAIELRPTIAALSDAAPRVLIGAGTITRAEHVHQAVAAGADFVVTPAVDDEVIRCAQGLGAAVIPVVAGYPEAVAAARESVPVACLDVPAPAQGHAAVSRYARLFPRLQFLPSGAIGPDDAGGYLREPAVVAIATTCLAGADEIRALARVAQAHRPPG